jgi:acetyl-CoA carboxylase carboxyl transferase subunit beta
MSWFKREDHEIHPTPNHEVRTEGLWVKCDNCRKLIWKADLEANLQVCPHCGFHFRIGSHERLNQLLDPGYEIVDTGLRSTDPLDFCDLKPYKKRLADAQRKTGLDDAIVNAVGTLEGQPVVASVMEYGFIGGSMGSVVGETIARAVDRAYDTRSPLIIVSASGGARMMEGIASLMQLAKISAGLARLDEAKIPYISLMTDPTTGGVTASFAMLGDLNIAEPGALIGFAGPRVIEQTIRQKLPEGFQRSEFLLQHGFLDAVVPRKELKPYLAQAFGWMAARKSA